MKIIHDKCPEKKRELKAVLVGHLLFIKKDSGFSKKFDVGFISNSVFIESAEYTDLESVLNLNEGSIGFYEGDVIEIEF